MTTKQDKLNAAFLSALMVLSVMVGSIAFAGGAAAASANTSTVSSSSAVQASSTGLSISDKTFKKGTPLTQTVTVSNITVTGQNQTAVTVDLSAATASGVTVSASSVSTTSTNITIQSSDTSSDKVTFNVASSSPEGTTDLATVTFDVSVTAGDEFQTDNRIPYTVSTSAGGSATAHFESYEEGSSVVTDNSNSTSIYSGETVTLIDNGASTDGSKVVNIYRVDGQSSYTHIREFNMGVGNVLNFDSTMLEAGQKYEFRWEGESTTETDVRSLGLQVNASNLNTSDDDRLTGTIFAKQGGRELTATLYNDGVEVSSHGVTLNGSAGGMYDFASQSAGSYTVEVSDDATGVTVSTDTITVKDLKGNAGFTQNSNLNERGDVIEVPIELTHSTEAYVKLGSSEANYLAYGKITDADGDGMVTLTLNTADVSGDQYGVSAKGKDKFSLNTEKSATTVNDALDRGTYDIATGILNAEADATGLSTFTIQPRSTNGITVYTASDSVDLSDNVNVNELTQRSDVAYEDLAILAVDVSGIYGQGLSLQNGDTIDLELTQKDPGLNTDGVNVNESQFEVIPDAKNDTLFLVMDTDTIESNNGDVDGGQSYNATVTVLENTVVTENQSVSADFTIDQRTASIATNESDMVVLGDEQGHISGESSVAPGTTVTVEVRDVNNAFIITKPVTVGADGSWETTLNMEDAKAGDEFTAIVRGLTTNAYDGKVVEGAGSTSTPPENTEDVTSQPETSTATPDGETSTEETSSESTTGGESDGSIPGFGLSAALIALVGAALIALRNN